MDRKRLGNFGESIAKDYLIENGYRILATNVWEKCGELDIVAWDPIEVLVFVEVKTYHTPYIDPRHVIRSQKKQHLWKSAQLYLLKHPHLVGLDCRFDLMITQYAKVVDHFQNITIA